MGIYSWILNKLKVWNGGIESVVPTDADDDLECLWGGMPVLFDAGELDEYKKRALERRRNYITLVYWDDDWDGVARCRKKYIHKDDDSLNGFELRGDDNEGA